jgi:hypothetical protein
MQTDTRLRTPNRVFGLLWPTATGSAIDDKPARNFGNDWFELRCFEGDSRVEHGHDNEIHQHVGGHTAVWESGVHLVSTERNELTFGSV